MLLRLGLAALCTQAAGSSWLPSLPWLSSSADASQNTAEKPTAARSNWNPKDGRARPLTELEQYYDNWNASWPNVCKWRHYFEIYDTHLSRFRGTDVHMAELGIAHGGSMKMWRWYFGERAHLSGLDIANSTRQFQGDPRFGRPDKIMIGNERFKSFWKEVRTELPRVDVFLDVILLLSNRRFQP